MKKTIIERIYHEAGDNVEFIKTYKPSKETLNKLLESLDNLKKSLSPEQLLIVEEHLVLLDDDHDSAKGHCFSEGFKFGLTIGLECDA